MPRGLQPALLLAVMAAACAAPAPDEDFSRRIAELQDEQRLWGCGTRGAMGFAGRERAQLGEAVRACELPTVADVEHACEVHQAVPGDTRDPENPDEFLYDLPDYTVDALSCTFADERNSRATCTFVLTTPTAAPHPIEMVLTHEFYARNTPLTFEYGTSWRTDGSCLPGAGTEGAN